MDRILEVKNLKTYFYNPSQTSFIRAVDNLSFEVKSGEILGIIGESGSGKTSLAHSILGLIPESSGPGIISGEIWFDNGSSRRNLLAPVSESCSIISNPNGSLIVKKDLRKWQWHESTMRSLRGKEIALIPQGTKSSLSPYLRVKEQICRAYIRGNGRGNSDGGSAWKSVEEIISVLNLHSVLNKYPHLLSGGECQRVAIGIALALNPILMIADEPTTGLDVPLQATTVELLERFANGHFSFDLRKPRRGLIVISHDERLIERLAHRVILMKAGRLNNERENGRMGEWETKIKSFSPTRPLTHSPTQSFEEKRPLVKIENLCFRYPLQFTQKLLNRNLESNFELKSISFEIPGAEILGIIGESGCGKTTLGKGIAALLPRLNSGAVLYNGKDIYSSSYNKVAYRKRVQMIFQNPESSLNLRMPVDKSIIEAVCVGTNGRLERSEVRKLAMHYLREVGLYDKADKLIFDLSGGEKRRMGIARALAVSPELIVADETFSGVDSALKAQLIELFLSQGDMRGLTYVFILHDLQLARQLCETIAVLYSGRLVEWGKTSEIFNLTSLNQLNQLNHPYTLMLLEASERLELPRQRLGQPQGLSLQSYAYTYAFEREHRGADKTREEIGCEFRRSCWLYKKLSLRQRKRCEIDTPRLRELNKDHKVACHFLD